jgi:hypothetical protein
MAMFDNNTKLVVTACQESLLYLIDLDGKILKSLNPNGYLDRPNGVCVLKDSNEEEIFVGDHKKNKIFVFNSNFEFKFAINGDKNLKNYYNEMQIDDVFDKTRIYVSEYDLNKITIWNISNRTFISKICIQSPSRICFTRNNLFVSSFRSHQNIKDLKKTHISQNQICIIEIDKISLLVKRRIIGNWCSPNLMRMELNGNILLAARIYDRDYLYPSKMFYLITIDQNGKIIKKVELNGVTELSEMILLNDKIIVSYRKVYEKTKNSLLKIFEFE